ncbi:MAG: RsmB/NOP family class I SAM-dependent RNA methyltransferase [Bacteroidales bacterium]|nr:RsmB/NOP family class I SAM-dependent RNA methyltransferase [Bacteroidales bacterium]
MKLHKNIVQAVIDGLEEIFGKGAQADYIVKKQIKLDRRWGSRDRKFIAESLYDLVRWWRWYLAIGAINLQDEQLYQKVFGVYLHEKGLEIPSWLEIPALDSEAVKEAKHRLEKDTQFQASIPDWLHEIGKKELGEIWDREINVLNQEAQVVLRANTLKTTKSKLMTLLENEGIEMELIPGIKDGVALAKRRELSSLKAFTEGLFEVQDASSQRVAPFSKVKSGQIVIDACAGAGGKTLHLAAQMENEGKLYAFDVEDFKLKELRKRSKRAGCKISRPHLLTDTTIEEFKAKADVLLLDAPCSGLGVLRRKPDTKWKLTPEKLEEYKSVQHHLLNSYPSMLKVGGTLVYATCSILPSENELQIARFLNENPGKYELEEEQKVLPSEGFDGFYMARLRKLAN